MSKKRRQERSSIPNHGRLCCNPPVSRSITQSRACHAHDRGLLGKPMTGIFLKRSPSYLMFSPCSLVKSYGYDRPDRQAVSPITRLSRACYPSGLPATSTVSLPVPHLMADSTMGRVCCQVWCFRGLPVFPSVTVPAVPLIRSPRRPIIPPGSHGGLLTGGMGGGGNYPIFQKIFSCKTFCM